jgi:hypothetical protein
MDDSLKILVDRLSVMGQILRLLGPVPQSERVIILAQVSELFEKFEGAKQSKPEVS